MNERTLHMCTNGTIEKIKILLKSYIEDEVNCFVFTKEKRKKKTIM